MTEGEEVEVVDGELLPECAQRGCNVIARPGQALCDVHTSVQTIAAARRKLALAAPEAAERLIAISETAASADVRRRAAESILDRAGVRAGVEVDVVVGQTAMSPADLLRERLATIRRRTLEGVAEDAKAITSAVETDPSD